jgi:hypothetical protein
MMSRNWMICCLSLNHYMLSLNVWESCTSLRVSLFVMCNSNKSFWLVAFFWRATHIEPAYESVFFWCVTSTRNQYGWLILLNSYMLTKHMCRSWTCRWRRVSVPQGGKSMWSICLQNLKITLHFLTHMPGDNKNMWRATRFLVRQLWRRFLEIEMKPRS